MGDEQERFRSLTADGFMPVPSSADAVVIHAEQGRDCRVVLGVFRPADQARKIAIVTAGWCMQSVFGYPNDEAYWHDPGGPAGGSTRLRLLRGAVVGLAARLIAYNNRHAFPDRTPAHYARMRHFFTGCHNASGEFLAENLTVEVTDLSYRDALRETLDRTAGLSAGW